MFEPSVIAPQDRRPLGDLAVVLAGVPFCVSGLLAGGALSKGLPLASAIEAALVGAVVVTLYAGMIGAIGARTGLSTAALMRDCFGVMGARLVAFILAVCLVGWYAVQTGFFGQTMQALFPGGGLLTSPKVAALWGGMLMLTSALFGIRGLALVSWIGVPLFAILSAWGLWAAVAQIDLWAVRPETPGSLGDAITLVIGSFAVGATVNADVTRYAKSTAHAWIATVAGFLIANVFVLVAGAATASATGTGDLIAAMVALGLGFPALLVLMFGQWTTNDNNLYYATVNLESAFNFSRKRVLVLVCGIAATTLAVLGLADRFVPFLIWLGVCIPPVGGIMMGHYLVVRKEGQTEGPAPRFTVLPFVAWISASVVGATVAVGVPAVNSIATAFVVYSALMLLTKRAKAHADVQA